MDKITKAFIHETDLDTRKHKIFIQQAKNGKWFFKDLPGKLVSIAKYGVIVEDNKTYIIEQLLEVFKDIEIVKVLCTTRHNSFMIMDIKTFNKRIRDIHIKEISNS